MINLARWVFDEQFLSYRNALQKVSIIQIIYKKIINGVYLGDAQSKPKTKNFKHDQLMLIEILTAISKRELEEQLKLSQ